MIRANGSSWAGAADGTQDVFADVAERTIKVYTANATIAENNGVVVISKTTTAAMTLARPTAGTDDGKRLRIVSTTGHAHVITCTGGFMPAASTITFAGNAGDTTELRAYNGYWYIQGSATLTNAYTGLTQSGTVNLIVGTKTTGISLAATYTTGISVSGTFTTGLSFTGGMKGNPIQVGTKSNAALDGLVLAGVTDDTGGVMLFCDDGGAAAVSVTSPIWSCYLLTVAQNGGGTATGMYAQLKTYGSITCTTGSFTALKAYNQAGTVTLVSSAEYGVINCGTTLEGNLVNTSGRFSGLDVNINTSAYTITDTASDTAGVIIRKVSTSTYGWPVGLKINDAGAITAISIGTCTTAITSTTGAISLTEIASAAGDGTNCTGIYQTLTLDHAETNSSTSMRCYIATDGTARALGNVWASRFSTTLKAGDTVSGETGCIYGFVNLGANATVGASVNVVHLILYDAGAARATAPHCFECFEDYGYAGSYSVAYVWDFGYEGHRFPDGSGKAAYSGGAKGFGSSWIGTLKCLLNGTAIYIPYLNAQYA